MLFPQQQILERLSTASRYQIRGGGRSAKTQLTHTSSADALALPSPSYPYIDKNADKQTNRLKTNSM